VNQPTRERETCAAQWRLLVVLSATDKPTREWSARRRLPHHRISHLHLVVRPPQVTRHEPRIVHVAHRLYIHATIGTLHGPRRTFGTATGGHIPHLYPWHQVPMCLLYSRKRCGIMSKTKPAVKHIVQIFGFVFRFFSTKFF